MTSVFLCHNIRLMIYGIGRNYAKHAQELGNTVPKGAPIVFFKPDASIVPSKQTVKLPPFSSNVHYEGEIAFRFGPNLEIEDIAIGNDLTARDKQKEAQDARTPWAVAKGFKQSTGFGNWVSLKEANAKGLNLKDLEFKVILNGKLVQHGFARDMVYDFDFLVKYLKETFPVQPGDMVLTGTPEGVGPLKNGDHLAMELLGLSQGEWTYE